MKAAMTTPMTRRSPQRTASAGGQRGVMLLEALIGILIFSIGILAMLAMQAAGMRATVDAKYRTEAAFLANDLVGTMWGDAGNLANYATASCSGNTNCNAWLTRVQATLPNSTGANAPTITISGRQATIVVKWVRPGDTSGTVSNHTVVAQVYRSTD